MCRLCAFALQHQKSGRRDSVLLSTHQFSSLIVAKQLANQVINKSINTPAINSSLEKELQ